MDLKVFGEEVRRARKKHGYTQESFAEKLDLDKNVISNLERGYKFPNRDNLFKIVQELNISLDKHLFTSVCEEDSKILKILEKYHDLPTKKKNAVEEIIISCIDIINHMD